MTINETIQTNSIDSHSPSRVWVYKVMATAAAAFIAVASLSTIIDRSGVDTEQPVIGRPAVPLTMEQRLQELVDKGLIPRQALEPAPLTMEQRLQDLVDKGLIPRQALEPKPVEPIEPVEPVVGPAHPLGDTGTDVPCVMRFYTRC